jgi:hypothetical protein
LLTFDFKFESLLAEINEVENETLFEKALFDVGIFDEMDNKTVDDFGVFLLVLDYLSDLHGQHTNESLFHRK